MDREGLVDGQLAHVWRRLLPSAAALATVREARGRSGRRVVRGFEEGDELIVGLTTRLAGGFEKSGESIVGLGIRLRLVDAGEPHEGQLVGQRLLAAAAPLLVAVRVHALRTGPDARVGVREVPLEDRPLLAP